MLDIQRHPDKFAQLFLNQNTRIGT
jgi:hypothetical protein